MSSSTSTQPCFRFSLAEIKSATRDFDDKMVIGQGGFGKVYKCCICIEETSHAVAVKRLDSMSNQGAPEFRTEIQMLSTLRHCHLVSLIGFCEDNREMILVYEYMLHGTLYDHLHKTNSPLSWMQRLKIAIGAARGMDYLHTGVGTQHGVIHRDVKTSNILLNENWEAMISDFGLSKIGPTNQSVTYIDASVKGTFGYLDPEYFYTRKLTRRTDVFAFGVVLFELLSGRLPVDFRHGEDQCSLVRWAQKCVKERKLDQLVDSSIAGTISSKCLRKFAQTAYCCLNSDPKKRPTMTGVVASLQALLELQKKYDLSPESPSIIAFPWKIQEYLFSTTKSQNSDQISTNEPKSHDTNKNLEEELVTRDVKIFTYCERKYATRDFGNDRFLGKGCYGTVYKGWVDQKTFFPNKHSIGLPIAVNKLHPYDNEMLKEYRHPNLIKLIGYCLKVEESFLVYEFLPNGNSEDLLCRDQILINKQKSHDKNMNLDEELATRDVKLFTHCELRCATGDFGNDRFLGDGRYGKVYKGWVDQKTYFPNKHSIGLPIAVIKLHPYDHFDQEMLKESRHPNLDKIIGYCLKGEESFLVYEFLPNRNSEDLLCSDNICTNEPKSQDKNMNQDEELVTRDVKIFTYCELEIATRDFGSDRFLGEGRYGKVYKGWVDKKTYFPNKHCIGLPVVVNKRRHYERVSLEKLEKCPNFYFYVCNSHLHRNLTNSLTQFDLEMLKEFRHPNLVKLIGYCLKGELVFLVYEFVPNGNLESLQLRRGVARLPLATKVKMVVGIARGIVFLHNTQLDKELSKADHRWPPRYEVDKSLLKRRKIFLDEDFTPKLSDYDVDKMDHRDSYPISYHDLDVMEPRSTFSGFKVLFAEILTGKRFYKLRDLRMIEHLFQYSLDDIAKVCFETCNEVDSESKMVTFLEKYDKLIQEHIVRFNY